jgi:hypothetical protein
MFENVVFWRKASREAAKHFKILHGRHFCNLASEHLKQGLSEAGKEWLCSTTARHLRMLRLAHIQGTIFSTAEVLPASSCLRAERAKCT